MQQGGSKGVLGALLIIGGVVLAYAVLTGRVFTPIQASGIPISPDTILKTPVQPPPQHVDLIPHGKGSGPDAFGMGRIAQPGDMGTRSMIV